MSYVSVVPLGTFPEFRQVSMEPGGQSFYFHSWFVTSCIDFPWHVYYTALSKAYSL